MLLPKRRERTAQYTNEEDTDTQKEKKTLQAWSSLTEMPVPGCDDASRCAHSFVCPPPKKFCLRRGTHHTMTSHPHPSIMPPNASDAAGLAGKKRRRDGSGEEGGGGAGNGGPAGASAAARSAQHGAWAPELENRQSETKLQPAAGFRNWAAQPPSHLLCDVCQDVFHGEVRACTREPGALAWLVFPVRVAEQWHPPASRAPPLSLRAHSNLAPDSRCTRRRVALVSTRSRWASSVATNSACPVCGRLCSAPAYRSALCPPVTSPSVQRQ